MSETLPVGISPPCTNCGVETPARGESSSGASSTEFRALLERLREQAASLERATEKNIRAEELSGAVQEAGASLHGVLSIAEGLMEAYRSSRIHEGASNPAASSTSGTPSSPASVPRA